MIKQGFIRFIAAVAICTLPFSVSAELVNINDASAAAISHHLKGIGVKKAESLVSYRELNGDFKSINDITNVKGIGEGLLKKNFADMSLTEGVVKLVKMKSKLEPVVIGSKKLAKSKSGTEPDKKMASVVVKKPKAEKAKKKKVSLDLFESAKASDIKKDDKV